MAEKGSDRAGGGGGGRGEFRVKNALCKGRTGGSKEFISKIDVRVLREEI